MGDPFGFLNVDKPIGLTSHDVVARIRRGLRLKKVGHAGTLDPLATGVLVICLGAATRLSEYAMAHMKTYRAEIRFGVVTDTYDAEGEIIAEYPVDGLSHEAIMAALSGFTGAIAQVPPMYSAIKQGGKKLYELARAGAEVEREARQVEIYALRVIDWQLPVLSVEVECSPGTYIRSLAYDLGGALGVGGHLQALRRTASGGFRVEDAVSLEALLADADWLRHVVPADYALGDFVEARLNAVDADHVLHGRAVRLPLADGDLWARAYRPDGALIALLQRVEGDLWRPHKVFV